MDMIDILMAKSAAVNAAKDYTDQKTQSLMGGVIYKGEVDYYNDLPAAADVEEGWSYTVKYAGTSGTVADGTEYVWGKTSPNSELGWISFSKDCYSKAETDALLAAEQEQINENKNNILSCKAFTDNASIDSNRKLYISATEPTGDISPNSTWIDGKTIKTYGRTDNYFDEKYTGISTNPNNIVYQPINVGDGDFTMSTTCPNVPGVNALLFFIAGNVDTGASSSNNGVTDNRSRTVTSINGYVTVAYRGSSDVSPVDYETIVNSGTTAESYVPYLQWQ